MTNEAQTEGRSKIADREWIDDTGQIVDESTATGFRYTFLGRTKEGVTIPPDGESFTRYWKDMSDGEKRMCGLFGAITLSGNICNTWMTNKGDKQAKACEAIKDRFEFMHDNDKWLDESATGGVRIDRDVLAQALVAIAEVNGKIVEVSAVRAKLEDDKWMSTMRQVPEVARKYSELMGRNVKSLGDALGELSSL